MSRDSQVSSTALVLSPRNFFQDLVSDAFEHRKMKTLPLAKSYLVDLLQFYVPAANLFDEVDASGKRTRATLAETFLRAQNAEEHERIELLKKMADRSLYISGFFGDSLQRKLVDVDYYADMGGMAYGALASSVREDTSARMFHEFGSRFLDFVEILTHISSQASLHSSDNLMRLFELYVKTGSTAAREKLNEKGIITAAIDQAPTKKQQ